MKQYKLTVRASGTEYFYVTAKNKEEAELHFDNCNIDWVDEAMDNQYTIHEIEEVEDEG